MAGVLFLRIPLPTIHRPRKEAETDGHTRRTGFATNSSSCTYKEV